MSIAKDNKTAKKPRILTLHCALQEWIDLANELDKQFAQFEDSKKVRNLFHRLLNRIKTNMFASRSGSRSNRYCWRIHAALCCIALKRDIRVLARGLPSSQLSTLTMLIAAAVRRCCR